jgi:phage FluMu gp28-like protein
LEHGKTVIVLSRSERLSKEFIETSVAPHIHAIGVVASYVNGTIPDTSISKNEVRIGKGRILAFPANPDTARSYEGEVVLDEFAFHQDARKIYEAVAPSITRGYSLSIISTPNGQQGAYYELANEAGLVDGRVNGTRWSAHKTDVHQAIEQGCRDRFGNPLQAEELRAGCLDEEMYLQEYCCQFLSIASQWISPELFGANVDEEAHHSYPVGEYDRNLYAGWDVARNKDLSVIWFLERVGDVSVTRGVIEYRNVPTTDQTAEMDKLMPLVRRLVMACPVKIVPVEMRENSSEEGFESCRQRGTNRKR